MIGINLYGLIPKFLSGGWTSEDIDNPVYSKKKSLSIKEQKLLLNRLKLGIKNFDKAARIGFGALRLHPTYGIAMNGIDMYNSLEELLKAKKRGEIPSNSTFIDYASNFVGAIGKGTYMAGKNNNNINSKNIVRRNRARLGNPTLMALGLMFGGQDYLLDIKDLYNTITE